MGVWKFLYDGMDFAYLFNVELVESRTPIAKIGFESVVGPGTFFN